MFKHVSLIAVLAFSFSSNIAFCATHVAKKTESVATTALPAVNKQAVDQIVQGVCAACHAADGNSAISLNPKLAGQHPEYLLKQLTNFKEGTRANAVMSGMVANLTTEDMQNLAAYFATQKQTLAKAKTNGAGSLGEKIYRGGIAKTNLPACAACHGANGAGIPKQFPRLAGQHADYIYQQLKTFRTGERANAPMMMVIAAKMTDAEMQAVSDYMQGLR
ncbi:COG2863 Cytochrome c553 [Methylophilaceae bacterium]